MSTIIEGGVFGNIDGIPKSPLQKVRTELQAEIKLLAARLGPGRKIKRQKVRHRTISTYQHSRAHESHESIFDALFHIRFESICFEIKRGQSKVSQEWHEDKTGLGLRQNYRSHDRLE